MNRYGAICKHQISDHALLPIRRIAKKNSFGTIAMRKYLESQTNTHLANATMKGKCDRIRG